MSDCIDRQKTIEHFTPWLSVIGYTEGELNMLKAVLYDLTTMPAVEPERKVGKWLHCSEEPIDEEKDEYRLGWMPWYCSQCGIGVGKHQATFCPNCGAKMEGEL